MSNNAWETTSAMSLHPLMHFLYHAIIVSLMPYNDVGDVVTPSNAFSLPCYYSFIDAL